jgi:hypothetical protein
MSLGNMIHWISVLLNCLIDIAAQCGRSAIKLDASLNEHFYAIKIKIWLRWPTN